MKFGVAANYSVRMEKGDDSLRIFATSGVTIFVEKKVKGEWACTTSFKSKGRDTVKVDLEVGDNVFRCVATATSARFRF